MTCLIIKNGTGAVVIATYSKELLLPILIFQVVYKVNTPSIRESACRNPNPLINPFRYVEREKMPTVGEIPIPLQYILIPLTKTQMLGRSWE